MKKENNMLQELLNQLPEYYILQKFPSHWECYDGHAKCKVESAVFKGETAEKVLQEMLKVV